MEPPSIEDLLQLADTTLTDRTQALERFTLQIEALTDDIGDAVFPQISKRQRLLKGHKTLLNSKTHEVNRWLNSAAYIKERLATTTNPLHPRAARAMKQQLEMPMPIDARTAMILAESTPSEASTS